MRTKFTLDIAVLTDKEFNGAFCQRGITFTTSVLAIRSTFLRSAKRLLISEFFQQRLNLSWKVIIEWIFRVKEFSRICRDFEKIVNVIETQLNCVESHLFYDKNELSFYQRHLINFFIALISFDFMRKNILQIWLIIFSC